jgi:hypothetical protein
MAQAKLEQACYQFHSKLYSSRHGSSFIRHTQQWIFEGLHSRLSPNLPSKLTNPIPLVELLVALKAMVAANFPEPNGIITESYKCLWLVIGP